MKSILKFIAWLAILLGGLFVLVYISEMTRSSSAGAGEGTGLLSYRCVASFQIFDEPEPDDFGYYSITMVAEEPPRFVLWGNRSPHYRKADLQWNFFRIGHENREGTLAIDLQSMSFENAGKMIPLNPDSLSFIFELKKPSEREEIIVKSLFDFLKAARDGGIPRPNHHGHRLPDPLPGSLQHSATGCALMPIELAWVGGWTLFGIFSIIRSRKQRHTFAEDSP